MQNFVIHKAADRGGADHGWLKAKHSFSFANYYNPQKMNFGLIRVLNDDFIEGGRGFGEHPHDNMEIITIPLSGALRHKDSMGNSEVIKAGDIQVMSAGTGIYHSEFNASADEPVKLLQIWLFPNKKNVVPRYDQITLNVSERQSKFQQILSPNANDSGVWIHQNAWFNMGNLEAGLILDYTLNDSNNGTYIFVIEGDIEVNNQKIGKRDAIGLWDISTINFKAISNAEVLIMEVPLN